MKQQIHRGRRNTTEPEALIQIAVATEISASQEAVFAYLSNLENNPAWNWAVTATTPLDGRPGRGARYLQNRGWPRPGSDILEITAHQPPRLLEVTGTIEDGRVRYRYRLTPIGSTSTRVDATVELGPTEATPRPDMYAARLNAAIAANLEDLGAVIIETQMQARLPVPR